jgi:hypothetical protein
MPRILLLAAMARDRVARPMNPHAGGSTAKLLAQGLAASDAVFVI